MAIVCGLVCGLAWCAALTRASPSVPQRAPFLTPAVYVMMDTVDKGVKAYKGEAGESPPSTSPIPPPDRTPGHPLSHSLLIHANHLKQHSNNHIPLAPLTFSVPFSFPPPSPASPTPPTRHTRADVQTTARR